MGCFVWSHIFFGIPFFHGIVNASRWSGRCHQKLEFADIQLEHPPLERPFSYYEKRSLKNELQQRLRLISKGSIFHGNFLMVQVRTFWIENNNWPSIVHKTMVMIMLWNFLRTLDGERIFDRDFNSLIYCRSDQLVPLFYKDQRSRRYPDNSSMRITDRGGIRPLMTNVCNERVYIRELGQLGLNSELNSS